MHVISSIRGKSIDNEGRHAKTTCGSGEINVDSHAPFIALHLLVEI
jgi:hypothetical protein